MKTYAFALLMLTMPCIAFAQDEVQVQVSELDPTEQSVETTTPLDDTPDTHEVGTTADETGSATSFSLMWDWGLNLLRKAPRNMKTELLGSRVFNTYLLLHKQLGKSHFSMATGLGIASEGYAFEKGTYTLARNASSRKAEIVAAKETIAGQNDSVLSSSLQASYVDFYLEACFHSNKEDIKEGVSVALGGKIGKLWQAHTTVRYKEDDQVKERQLYDTFQLNKFRYTLIARLGWGRWGGIYEYGLVPLFVANKGPKNDIKTHRVSLSIDLF